MIVPVKVSRAMFRDIGYVEAIEIKAQDYPLLSSMIKGFIESNYRSVYIAKIKDKVVGISMVTGGLNEFHLTVVNRVSVHPQFRDIGVGKQLMLRVEADAWKQQHTCLRMYMPSYKIDDPTDPDYLGGWLKTNHFKAVDVYNDWYFRYGKNYDAYVFERPL